MFLKTHIMIKNTFKQNKKSPAPFLFCSISWPFNVMRFFIIKSEIMIFPQQFFELLMD